VARRRAALYQSTVARERKLVARASVRDVTRVLAAVASDVNSRVVRVADHGTSPADTQRVARRAKAALEIGVARESSGDSNTGERVLGVTRVAEAARGLEATRVVVIALALEATGVVEVARVLEATQVVEGARALGATRVAEAARGLGATRVVEGAPALGATRVVEGAPALEATRVAEGARGLGATRVVEGAPALEATRVVEVARALEATRVVEVARARVGRAALEGLVGSSLTGVRRASVSRKHLGADGLESDAKMG